MKLRLLLMSIFLYSTLFNLFAQENVPKTLTETGDMAKPGAASDMDPETGTKPFPAAGNYFIRLNIRVFDDERQVLVNSSWDSVTVSGKPVNINVKGSNLNLTAILILYRVDETTVMLLAHGKVLLKPVGSSGGKYYSTVNTLPLKIGEKALFFPLGLIDEKMENISSCVLEIEVHHYDKMHHIKENTKGSADNLGQENRAR